MWGQWQEGLRAWRLTPCGCKGIGKSLEVMHPRLSNSAEHGILAEGKVADQHGGMAERLVERIRVVNCAVKCFELKGAGRAFDKSPGVTKEAVQVV
jgi:hypothetical protein